jgi:hypothetical protein
MDDFEYAPLAQLPAIQPSEPVKGRGWAIDAAMRLHPMVQAYQHGNEALHPSQEGYNPFDDEQIKGMSQYVEWFTNSRSPAQTAAIKDRIIQNTELRKTEDQSGNFWTGLAAAAMDPVNFIPLPGVAGSGFVRGAIKTGVSVLALQAGESALQMQVDPTANIDEELAKMKYAAFFGTMIGGVLGRSGAKASGDMANQFVKDMQHQDAKLGAIPLETKTPAGTPHPVTGEPKAANESVNAAESVAPRIVQEGETAAAQETSRILPNAQFEVRPTAEGGAGVAPAFGLEKIAEVANEGMRLVGSGVQAIGDLAQAIGFDGGFMTKGNKQGLETMPSAFMRSQRWVALAKGTYSEIENIWAKAIFGGQSLNVVGLNVGAVIQRTADATKKVLRKDNPNVSFAEFNEALFEARTSGKVPDMVAGKELSSEMKAAINEALPVVDRFFSQARVEAVHAGWIKTDEFMRRQALDWKDRLSRLTNRRRQLENLPNPSQSELAEYAMTNRALQDLIVRVKRIDYDKVATDGELAAIVDRNLERMRSDSAAAQMDFDVLAHTAEADRIVRRELADELQLRLATGEELSAEQHKLLDDLTRPEITPVISTVEGGKVDPNAAYSLSSWSSAYDQHGLRRADQAVGAKAVPAHLEQLQQLANILAGHFDMPEVKVWMGSQGPGKVSLFGEMHYTDAVSRGGEMIISDHLKPAEALVTFLHEFSHAVDFNIFQHLPQSEQNLITQEYRKAMAGRGNKSLYQFDNSSLLNQEGDRGQAAIRKSWMDYRNEFVEWFAEQGVSWLTTNRAPTTAIERIFSGVADEWRNLYRTVSGREGTAAEIESFFGRNWKTSGITLDQFLKDAPELTAALERLQQVAERRSPEIKALHSETQDILGQLMRGEIKFAGPSNEAKYLPHRWNIEKVIDDQNGDKLLNQILVKHFIAHPEEMRWKTPEYSAQKFIESLITKDDDELKAVSEKLGWSHNKNRQLSISGSEIKDFVETNVSQLIHDYSQRGGIGIEYSRMFKGDPLAKDAIHDVYIQAAKEWKGSVQEFANAKRGWDRDFDVLMRTAQARMGAGMPLTMDRVAVDTAINYTNMALMGGVVKSAVVEAARPMMVHGFMRTFDFTIKGMLGNWENMKVILGDLKNHVNEGLDVAHGLQTASFFGDHGPRRATQTDLARFWDGKVSGFNNFAQGAYFVMNGLAHITDMLKNYTMVMSSHFMIEDIQMLASGNATKQLTDNLAAYGINAETAKLILQMPIEKAQYLNLPNLGKWEDQELATKFATAVGYEVRRSVVTPGPMDKTALQQGFLFGKDGSRRDVAALKLPFQFMSWGIAANNKVLLSALQGRDAGVMSGMVALAGMGYLSSWLKSTDAAWDKMSAEERMLTAIENSGLLAQFSDLNKLIEFGSGGKFGARPMLGLDPPFKSSHPDRDFMTTPFGAVGSQAVRLYDAFTDPYLSQDQRASFIRRSLPLNTLPYTSGLFKGVQDAAVWGYNRF